MPPLNPKDRDDLVAFLDGELDEASAKDLEARLQLDPKARAEAVALRKTWELLDYLPRPEPSVNFTNRTLERVSALRLPAGARRGRWPWWAVAASWAAAVLVAFAAGFGATGLLTRPPSPPGTDREPADPLAKMNPAQVEQQLVRNLRILENLRLYENVEDIEFLQAMDDPDLFGEVDATN